VDLVEVVSQVADTELVANALDGDRAAFGELVRRHQDRLYHSVFHFCGAAEEAQDVVQDALVQAFLKLHMFRRDSAFYTWLYRIAMNLLISQKRRVRVTVSLDGFGQGRHDPIDGRARPSAALERQDRVTQVRAALLALSDEHRQVLVLREIEGWPYDTIADLLDLPIGTVRSRLHRARLELRDLLKPVYEENLK
jgi:RNA polymerase sigma-70 factor (ECF subfamily)